MIELFNVVLNLRWHFSANTAFQNLESMYIINLAINHAAYLIGSA
jgi:hypothetical protein